VIYPKLPSNKNDHSCVFISHQSAPCTSFFLSLAEVTSHDFLFVLLIPNFLIQKLFSTFAPEIIPSPISSADRVYCVLKIQ